MAHYLNKQRQGDKSTDCRHMKTKQETASSTQCLFLFKSNQSAVINVPTVKTSANYFFAIRFPNIFRIHKPIEILFDHTLHWNAITKVYKKSFLRYNNTGIHLSRLH